MAMDMLNFADHVIGLYRKGIRPTTKELEIWDEFIHPKSEDVCPAVSPNSQKPCELKDAAIYHKGSHKASHGAVAWAVTKVDQERWNVRSLGFELSTKEI